MKFFPSSLSLEGRVYDVSQKLAVGFSALAMAAFMLVAPSCYAANAAAHSPWVATWGAAMVATNPGNAPDFTGQTLREIVHSSVGGQQARVWLSNRFGTEPLHIGAAHIALSASGSFGTNPDGTPNQSGIQSGTDHALTFNGSDTVVIAPGAEVVSDPVALNVPALTDIAISIYFPDHAMATHGAFRLEPDFLQGEWRSSSGGRSGWQILGEQALVRCFRRRCRCAGRFRRDCIWRLDYGWRVRDRK